jgi:hypothetical protein
MRRRILVRGMRRLDKTIHRQDRLRFIRDRGKARAILHRHHLRPSRPMIRVIARDTNTVSVTGWPDGRQMPERT